jgi:hypothetical protein
MQFSGALLQVLWCFARIKIISECLLDVVCFFQVFGERLSNKRAVGFVRIFVDGLFLSLEKVFLVLI